jgi:hypothetical protein
MKILQLLLMGRLKKYLLDYFYVVILVAVNFNFTGMMYFQKFHLLICIGDVPIPSSQHQSSEKCFGDHIVGQTSLVGGDKSTNQGLPDSKGWLSEGQVLALSII